MTTHPLILHVAIATPLRRLFDYLPDDVSDLKVLQPGLRVSIPFGRRRDVPGIVISISNKSDISYSKLRKINRIIDKQPVFTHKHLSLLKWASDYYHYSIGEVVFSALPSSLRKNISISKYIERVWCLTKKGAAFELNLIKKASKQSQILNYLQQRKSPVYESDIDSIYPRSKLSLLSLKEKDLITISTEDIEDSVIKINKSPFKLNKDQKSATDEILKSIDNASVFLLNGLTGSGKTEVYMRLMESTIESGKQCLVLLPEIGLTPQQIQRFKDRFEVNIAIQHSGLSDLERTQYWLAAKSGKAKIIIGTRSAIWTQLANPGLYIIDEEHDLSYKQQDGFRYSARDMLISRSSRDKVPVILGSATPSLESLYNVKKNRYKQLVLSTRTADAKPPKFHLLDIRGKKMFGPISQSLVDEITKHLDNKNQVLLFLNRRGYAVHLFCHNCGWKAECSRCELPYTYHKGVNRLICHHCGVAKRHIEQCPDCNKPLLLMGHGTERIEEVLATLFP
ncbi:primosomal protein N', partial [Gammaproteobacteria bacterium]|nr:primosomal protein N' [Gammaproteobacteria bacterium]